MLHIYDPIPGVRCIGLNRPEKRNAISVDLTFAMEAALLDLQCQTSISVLIFHGMGGHFSAGMDMKDFFDSSTRPPALLQQARNATEHWRTRLLLQLPQKIITAVQGYCLGAAMPILAASDVVIADRASLFGFPEINFGFVPGGQIVKAASTAMTRRGLDYAVLTGELFSVSQAQEWGLVSCISDDDPVQQAIALAACIQSR